MPVDPWLLAALLYLGSGIGLRPWRLRQGLSGYSATEAPLTRRDLRWLAGAIVFGGVIGPVLLTHGLPAGTAVQSSLLLNLDAGP